MVGIGVTVTEGLKVIKGSRLFQFCPDERIDFFR